MGKITSGSGSRDVGLMRHFKTNPAAPAPRAGGLVFASETPGRSARSSRSLPSPLFRHGHLPAGIDVGLGHHPVVDFSAAPLRRWHRNVPSVTPHPAAAARRGLCSPSGQPSVMPLMGNTSRGNSSSSITWRDGCGSRRCNTCPAPATRRPASPSASRWRCPPRQQEILGILADLGVAAQFAGPLQP